jgi:hypothetical protein
MIFVNIARIIYDALTFECIIFNYFECIIFNYFCVEPSELNDVFNAVKRFSDFSQWNNRVLRCIRGRMMFELMRRFVRSR